MQRKKNPPRILFFGILAIIFLIFLIGFVEIKNIDCETQYGKCPAEVEENLLKLEDTRLFLFKRKVSKVLENFPIVKEYSLQYQIPPSAKIFLAIRKPDYALGNLDKSQYALIDRDGLTLLTTPKTSLPTVLIGDPLPMEGEVVKSEYKNTLDILLGMYAMYQVRNGSIEKDSFFLTLPNNSTVIFPVNGDVELLLGKTRVIYTKISDGDATYKELDLRFKNPILR